MTEPRDVWPLAAELGEGPVWVERDRALWFVDIKRQQIHRFDPTDGSKNSWDAPEQVGFVFPADRGGFVAGLQSGLYHFDDKSGGFELIAKVEADKPDNRLNDGIVDPQGRLWFGTMDNKEKAKSGAFYCFADGKVTATGIDDIAITNGPAVSPDGRLLYLVDTLKGTIEVADIGDDGSLDNRRPFTRIEKSDGHPDGPTIDSNGYLPVHNRIYSHPQRPGDVTWNTANSRNRRIFNDPAGLAAGRNQRAYLIQSYARDMGNGNMVMMREIDVPIRVKGRHWGGFRTAYKL